MLHVPFAAPETAFVIFAEAHAVRVIVPVFKATYSGEPTGLSGLQPLNRS
jgi:hypothetical protein